MVDRVAEGSSLENCSIREGAGGSNPSPSATDNSINMLTSVTNCAMINQQLHAALAQMVRASGL